MQNAKCRMQYKCRMQNAELKERSALIYKLRKRLWCCDSRRGRIHASRDVLIKLIQCEAVVNLILRSTV